MFIRMGNAPEASVVPYLFNDQIWEYLDPVICNSTAVNEHSNNTSGSHFYPDPAADLITYSGHTKIFRAVAIDISGRQHALIVHGNQINLNQLSEGVHILRNTLVEVLF